MLQIAHDPIYCLPLPVSSTGEPHRFPMSKYELIPEQRLCIEQFYLHKKSYVDIADETGYTLMQVKSYIQNGKRNLRMLLLKQMNHER